MCRSFVPMMRGRGYGRIVNITSTMSHVSLPGRTAYSASKAAIRVYLEAIRLELKHQGVRVVEIPTKRGLVNATTQAIDSHGRIHVATIHLPDSVSPETDWKEPVESTPLSSCVSIFCMRRVSFGVMDVVIAACRVAGLYSHLQLPPRGVASEKSMPLR